MFSLFGGLLRGQARSKDVAKERLRLVLMHDRAGTNPELLDELREALIEAISRYVDIDRRGMQVDLRRRGQSMALTANIPLRGLRRGAGGRD